MSTKPDGGLAFPVLHAIDGNWVKEPREDMRGMSLHDYYVGCALTGLLAQNCNGERIPADVIASQCDAAASALIELREKRKTQ